MSDEQDYKDYLDYVAYQQYVASQGQQPQPAPQDTPGGAPQAFLEGAGEQLTLGNLPAMQAAVGTGLQSLLNIPDKGIPSIQNLQDLYEANKQENIQRHAAQSEQHPVANMAGKATGFGLTMAVPMGEAAKGASYLSSAARAAIPGAAMGFATALEEEGLENRLKGAAIGGLLGAGAGVVGQKLRRMGDVNALKKSVKAGQHVAELQDEIGQATNQITQNVIKPESKKLQQYLSGKMAAVNINDVQEVAPQLAKKIVGQADEAGNVMLPANKVNWLKRRATAQAGYKKGALYDAATIAKNERMQLLGDTFRRSVEEAAPEVAQANSELQKAIGVRNRLSRRSKTNPVSALKISSPTDPKLSDIRLADKLTDGNLEYTSKILGQTEDQMQGGGGIKGFLRKAFLPGAIAGSYWYGRR